VFHDAAEICLLTGIDPQFLPQGEEVVVSGHTVSFNQEMVDHMLGGLDLIEELMEPGCIIRVEEQVSIESYTLEPGGFGTSDVIIIYPHRRKIIVFDWKYGKVAVSPIENDQAILYGLGAWDTVAGELFDWNPEGIEVELIIYQPRIPDGGGRWETTMEWLLEEGDRIRIDAAATYDPNAPRVAGEKQCKYCRARADCATHAAYNLGMVGLRFEDIDEGIQFDVTPPLVEDFEGWTPERMSYVWLHRKAIKRWLDALHDHMMARYAAGEELPFLKVVKGRGGNRFWQDPKAVERYLVAQVGEEKAYQPKTLITPPVAEELLGKKKVKEDLALYIGQPEGKPTLVPITASGDPLPSKMVQFDGIEADEDGEE